MNGLAILQPFNGHLPLWFHFYLRWAIARDAEATLAMRSFSNHDVLP